MTPGTQTRPGLRSEIADVLTTVAVPHHEGPAVRLRRRITVAIVLVIGAALLGYSLTREPGDPIFYWLTLSLAGVWSVGAFVSGPLHLGCIRWRGRNKRPVITGTLTGLLLGGVFVVGGLVAREIPPVADTITNLLAFAYQGQLSLILALTLINGLAEEIFFRGALYTSMPRKYRVVVSTILYTAATSVSGNPMLGFAAVILGLVCAFERRATGGVLAPMLTHLMWGLIMVLALPPIFLV